MPSSIAELMQRGEHDLEEGRSTLDESALTSAQQSFEEGVHLDGKNAGSCFLKLTVTIDSSPDVFGDIQVPNSTRSL
jgi:hypothetical protein